MTGKQRLVEFQIDNVSYGVDIDLVKEILMTWTIIPVSTFRKEVSGVIFLRGDDIPIINIRHLLDGPNPDAPHTGQRIIIIGIMNAMWRSFGLLVDSVCNVIEVMDQVPEKMSSSDPEAFHPYIKRLVTGRILVDGVGIDTCDEVIHPSVIWLNSDKLIDTIMKGCIHLEPKVPYI